MMMSLGLFVFSLPSLAYQELQRQTTWRHPASERVGARAVRQFVGPGEDSIALSGWVSAELGNGAVSLARLRAMADDGISWPLVGGDGRVLGAFVIESMSETQTLFHVDGTPRRIEFQVQLQRVDERLDGFA